MSTQDNGQVEASEPHDHPTTTHAERGAGHPRLVFNTGADFELGDARTEFPLTEDRVTIGSTDDSSLQLAGLLPLHAEIRHDDRDEYLLFTFGDAELSSAAAGSESDEGYVLRDGARVKFGEWSMHFARDEFADHGRPFGGRQGGEGAHQRRQPDRDSDTGRVAVVPTAD